MSSSLIDDARAAQVVLDRLMLLLHNERLAASVMVLVAMELVARAAENARDRESFLSYVAARVLTLPHLEPVSWGKVAANG